MRPLWDSITSFTLSCAWFGQVDAVEIARVAKSKFGNVWSPQPEDITRKYTLSRAVQRLSRVWQRPSMRCLPPQTDVTSGTAPPAPPARGLGALTASSWCPHRAHSASRTTTRWTRPPAVLTNSWQLVLSRTTSWKSLHTISTSTDIVTINSFSTIIKKNIFDLNKILLWCDAPTAV